MKCPICDQPVKWQGNPYRPFCSERCKLIDFGRWANEEYRVPGPESPATEIETDEERPVNAPPSLEEE
ncbi:MAG: DNA gyrase inhibitor YacG [Pyrinomonadaceae bacterium]|nr:DNA gyrase inhibitor YacG [Pyrinomonadaceae bacterium]